MKTALSILFSSCERGVTLGEVFTNRIKTDNELKWKKDLGALLMVDYEVRHQKRKIGNPKPEVRPQAPTSPRILLVALIEKKLLTFLIIVGSLHLELSTDSFFVSMNFRLRSSLKLETNPYLRIGQQ